MGRFPSELASRLVWLRLRTLPSERQCESPSFVVDVDNVESL